MHSPQPSTAELAAADTTSRSRFWPLGIGALLLMGAVAFLLARTHSHAGVPSFAAALRSVSLVQLALGILTINAGVALRAARWALLMPPGVRPRARVLVAPQFVGFAAVSLFGRAVDLARPYFIAKRTGTPVTTQIAVYSIERGFDLAATAVLFSAMLLFVPPTAPHHEAFSRAGILASVATASLLSLAVLVRSSGDRLAQLVRAGMRRLSPRLADAAADRIRELQIGFSYLRSAAQFAGAFALSLVIWLSIAWSYLFVVHSFTATPELARLRLPAILLLMATSMGASLLQLPIVGWLTTTAALGAAYHGFYGVPAAAASLCGILTFAVITLSVIPPGLLLAQRGGLSLRELRRTAPTSQATA